MNNISNLNAKTSVDFEHATGTIDYRFTNDYMFRAILQKNERVLNALVCALLHLDSNDIQSIYITNPIELGKSIDSKSFILDISVLMNNNTNINLEMQVQQQPHWTERSLSYLCRSFDQLYSGEEYSAAGPAIHIGFLDFTPFEEYPEFYASYKLLNVKNHHLYSSKFCLNVVDLTQIDLATEEDKAYRIDYWARLFKATTWEELRMISKNDPNLTEASKTLYALNGDETIRAQCRARADYERLHNTIRITMEKLNADNERLTSENNTLTSENNTLTSENDMLKKILSDHGISYPSDSSTGSENQ
jgi:predicted transposase/invertase (TIGR01784 family)